MSTPEAKRGGGFLAGTTTDRPGQAASVMVGALFMLGLQDSIVKLVSAETSLWQFQMIRSAINLVLLILLARVIWGSASPRPKRFWAVALRSLFLVLTMICYFGGVPFLSLAELAAGLYVFPLFVAVLSALLLGERVGPRRILAILIGFAGTLLILKPGTEAFRPVALMPVAAALCYAATILTTRRLCRAESPVTLAHGVSVTFLIAGTLGVLIFSRPAGGEMARAWPYLFTGWHAIDLRVVALIATCSVLNVVANIGLAKAYQSAEASWLVPFDYSYVLFATFWGFVFWRHVPDGPMFLGMVMITGSGAFVAWRERRESRFRRANFNRNLR